MQEVINLLIESDNASNAQEAEKIIKEMRSRILDGEDYEDVLFEYDLDLDYAIDILY